MLNLKNVFNEHEMKEGQKLEFKTSIFMDPETHLPGTKQMHTIAETLAAFMNADGGTLLLGVSDDKKVKGIEADLDVLEHQSDLVVARSVRGTDEGHTYGGTTDKYELKLRAIVKAYLSSRAQGLVGNVLFGHLEGKTICRVDVHRCEPDDYVYSYFKRPAKPEVAEICVRFGNQKRILQGTERDEFVTRRVQAGFSKQLDVVRQALAGAGGSAALVASVQDLLTRLDGTELPGVTIIATGGQPFTETAVNAVKRPKSLAWEGAHYAEVSGWQELVLKVLEKLQELDAAKFDALATEKEFKRHLLVVKPREKHGDCFTTKFGAHGSIRIKKSLGNKVYLYQSDKILRRIIDAFGIDVGKFMFVAE